MTRHWSDHQLTEFFDAVIAMEDESIAVRVAVERTVEALGAELGALVRGNAVLACVGLGRETPPMSALNPVTVGAVLIDVPHLGLLHAAAAQLDGEISAHLVVGRIDDEFTGEERQLLKGMAGVLSLALRGLRVLQVERTLRIEYKREAAERLRLLDTLGERHRLLESLLTIQRAISRRAPLQGVLDAVTGGAGQLLNDAFVALVLKDPVDGRQRIVSSAAPSDDIQDHAALVMQAAAQPPSDDGGIVPVTDADGFVALAAAVHIEGIPTGNLVMVTPASVESAGDHGELISAFAEQASLALTDAQTVEAMRDAFHDSLTGLPNRALFLDSLNQALGRATRLTTDVNVLFIDLDRFKDVNDSLGHAAGDQLLASVAGRIRECLRGTDMAARLGGDEFAVLLERTTGHRDGRVVADRITRALLEPIQLVDRQVFASASIGIAASNDAARTPDDLMRNADVAMYSAKRSNTRDAVLFEPSMHTERMQSLALRGDLAHAVARGELDLNYQPMVELDTGAAVAVEALVRWHHPYFGVVPPDVFVPLAERDGTIVEIGTWVLRRGCEQAAAWRLKSLPDLRLSINVSARQLEEPGFPKTVERALRDAGLPSAALTLEITESALVQDPDRTLTRLAPLKALGVRLAIDDFGTGYSSLAWLQHFPADQLKIDKAFIDTIETSTEGAAIVGTIAELARTLRLETVAEGIHTAGQLELLKALSCDLGQGYYFAMPLADDAVESFFERSRSAPSASQDAITAGLPAASDSGRS